MVKVRALEMKVLKMFSLKDKFTVQLAWTQVNKICPSIPAPCLNSQVKVAAKGVADSSPTPTPFRTAWKSHESNTLEHR